MISLGGAFRKLNSIDKININNKLCIITHGRTGSTALIRILNQNFYSTNNINKENYRKIFAVGEILNSLYLQDFDINENNTPIYIYKDDFNLT